MKLPHSPTARPQELTLVSHALCPYVQRAAIVLAEKDVAYTRRDVDLAAKPDWFLAISPLGKTPALLADGHALFESAVICEYLDDTVPPRLHPGDALERARDRAWMEFGSSVLNTIAAYYHAPDAPALHVRRAELDARFAQLEAALGDGPWFRGARFGMVDAVFGPVFRYFDVFEACGEAGWFDATPRLRAWREALRQRPSVRKAASPDYPRLLRQFLLARGGELARRIAARDAHAAASPASVK